MGSNLKKIRSLNLKTKIFFVGLIASLGCSGTFFLNNFLEEAYNSRKSNLEERISRFLNKKVDLGVYSGVRLLGFSLANPIIIDEDNLNSEIKANNIYVGIMPLKSFLNQKWVIKIRPYKAEINVDKDFFKTINSNVSNKKIYY